MLTLQLFQPFPKMNFPSGETDEQNVQKKPKLKRLLSPNFEPSPYTVILGRGKKCSESCGNRRLRVIASMHLDQYSNAISKEDKSEIVSKIHDAITTANPNKAGAFVRQLNDGRWAEVDEAISREKVGQVLRDLLHTKYRSSMKNKVAERRKKRIASRHSSVSSTTERSCGSSVESYDTKKVAVMMDQSILHQKEENSWPPRDIPSNQALGGFSSATAGLLLKQEAQEAEKGEEQQQEQAGGDGGEKHFFDILTTQHYTKEANKGEKQLSIDGSNLIAGYNQMKPPPVVAAMLPLANEKPEDDEDQEEEIFDNIFDDY